MVGTKQKGDLTPSAKYDAVGDHGSRKALGRHSPMATAADRLDSALTGAIHAQAKWNEVP